MLQQALLYRTLNFWYWHRQGWLLLSQVVSHSISLRGTATIQAISNVDHQSSQICSGVSQANQASNWSLYCLTQSLSWTLWLTALLQLALTGDRCDNRCYRVCPLIDWLSLPFSASLSKMTQEVVETGTHSSLHSELLLFQNTSPTWEFWFSYIFQVLFTAIIHSMHFSWSVSEILWQYTIQHLKFVLTIFGAV